MAYTRTPWGVACIPAGAEKRVFRRFKTQPEATRFIEERQAAGDTVLHVENYREGIGWEVVERFADVTTIHRSERSRPRVSHLTDRERGQRYFPRWRLAIIERQNHLCECGARATVVGYPPGTKRSADQPLDIDALIAVCDKCAGELDYGIAA